jgi:hypothetical protein
MRISSTERLLAELESFRYRFGHAAATRVAKLLQQAGAVQFHAADSLIRFHEVLLVLRAFPPSPAILAGSQRLLDSFYKRVDRLRVSGTDMDVFDPLEVSGIAGTVMQDALGFDLVRWLVKRLPGKVEIAWDDFDDERAMAAVWPRVMPWLEEDVLTEANIPWRKWLEASQGNKRNSPLWLIERFDALPVSEAEKSRIYESLHMPIRWHLENARVSRTRNWRPVRRVFYHPEPLLTRKDVSLAEELSRRLPTLTPLSRAQGERIMNLIREVMLARYRELYGTTLGDPASVVRADVGRGVVIYLWGLPTPRRLPLRAYTAGLSLKNGVPINYIEAIALFEWVEVGFNTFYTFRGGEVAWIFAQVLRCLCRHMGTTCISMYPYQLGQNNDEAIESGAFWFYRKLGFRPGRADLLQLVQREERRIQRNPNYKTPPRTLRRLAEGHVFYELPGGKPGVWHRFSTRNLGFLVNRYMAAKFGGNLEDFKRTTANKLARILDTPVPATNLLRNVFENFAMLTSLIPELPAWTAQERNALQEIIRAKSGPSEMRYLRLLQEHQRLRSTLLKVGSRSQF